MGDTSGKKETVFSQVKQIGSLTTIPVVLLVGPILGYFFGNWVDRKFQLFPWFTIFFVFAGFFAAGREIFRLLKQVLKEDEKKDGRKGS